MIDPRLASLLLAIMSVCCADNGAPDDESNLQSEGLGIYSESGSFLRPDIETFIGTFSGAGGVLANITADAQERREGSESLRATVTVSGDGFAGWFVSWGDAQRVGDASFTRDMSAFVTGSLRFWLRSAMPLEVGIRSADVPAGREASKVVLGENHGFEPNDTWQKVCILMNSLAGPSPRADLTRMKVLFVIASSGASGGTGGVARTFWVDDVRWLSTSCP